MKKSFKGLVLIAITAFSTAAFAFRDTVVVKPIEPRPTRPEADEIVVNGDRAQRHHISMEVLAQYAYYTALRQGLGWNNDMSYQASVEVERALDSLDRGLLTPTHIVYGAVLSRTSATRNPGQDCTYCREQ